jgi:opacity protein-like surface antigen
VKPLSLALAFLAVTAVPCFAQAQTQSAGMSLRPFVALEQEQFAARTTFDAVFGRSHQTVFGGGLNIVEDEQYYLELSASRFRKTGQRAFIDGDRVFGLGIPLRVTVTPFEMTAGYRFILRHRGGRRTRLPIMPYVGGGVGLYRYQESSDFSNDDEQVDERHVGGIAEAGIELRLQRWIGVAADVRYTRVPGILGDGGLSEQAGESDLGGIGARFRVIVGR